jgi:rubrerythrin
MEIAELTVADVTKMALTMEEKGENLYSWAARKFDTDEVVVMFKRLAAEEKEHAMVFKRLLELPDAHETISADSNRYLMMLAGVGDIFPSHREINEQQVKTPTDALAMGIQAEKDSILFYQEMYNHTKSTEVKQALSKLLEEEKMHLLELRDSMEELNHFQG